MLAGAHPRDVEQAECVVALFSLVAPATAALDAPYQDALSKHREDILECLSRVCMHAGELRGTGRLKGPPLYSSQGGGAVSRNRGNSGAAARPVGAASPLALKSGPAGLHASSPMDSTVTPPSGALVSPLLAGGVGGFTPLRGVQGALAAVQPPAMHGTAAGTGGVRSEVAHEGVPWMLAMHCLNFACASLWGCGPDMEPLHLWPPGNYTAGGGMRNCRQAPSYPPTVPPLSGRLVLKLF